MGHGAALGLGVGVGFALSVVRLGLWVSPLRPTTGKARLAIFLTTVFVIPTIIAFAMPSYIAGLLVWVGSGVGVAIATPIVLPLAHVLGRRERPPAPHA